MDPAMVSPAVAGVLGLGLACGVIIGCLAVGWSVFYGRWWGKDTPDAER